MATIYTNAQGRQVYDFNGQTIDAKTGQPVSGSSAPVASVIPTSISAQSAPQNSSYPTSNLQPGANGPAVKQLQDFLVSQGLMTPAQVATGPGIYGPQTTAAVKQLQDKLGIDNSSGPGYWGPHTIGALQGATTGPAGGTGGAGSDGGGDSGGFVPKPTGDPQMDAAQAQYQKATDALVANGQLPANLQITPDITAQFLSWAHQYVDPQTQQLIASKAADINSALQNYATNYKNSVAQTVQDFGTQLATEQNNAGAAGTAFSGQRALNENNMAASTNRTLNTLGANTAYQVGSALRSGAADLGSANAGMLQLPTLATGQVSLTGGQRGSSSNGNALDFGYNPSIYTAGNIPTQQYGALNTVNQDYLKQYNSLAAANTTRPVSDLLGMITNKPAGI